MAVSGDYGGSLFAEFYDIVHAGLSDVEAYLGFASECGPRILELGCGTGRILIPLANVGFQVTGVDASSHMLDACRRKLEWGNREVAGRVRLVQADILNLDLDDRFDLVLAPCNLLNHFLTTKEALRMLERARAHLAPNGAFAMDNSIPDIGHMVRTNGVSQRFEFTHPLSGTTIVDTFTSTYDFPTQMEVDHILLEELSGSEVVRREELSLTLTYYFPREVRLLLAAAGFDIVREQGSLLEDVPITSRSGEMVFMCRKRGL
ncbi:MAG: class I SAM-dependent methyltransferase [Bacillota bacterium]|jgi:SAM-dependent methyltransferase